MKIETARTYYTYIMTNQAKTAFETGVTGNLAEKVGNGSDAEPQEAKGKACHHLVHFEGFDEPLLAIRREEQIRSYSRKRKTELIDQSNPGWRFLNDDIRSLDHILNKPKPEPQ